MRLVNYEHEIEPGNDTGDAINDRNPINDIFRIV